MTCHDPLCRRLVTCNSAEPAAQQKLRAFCTTLQHSALLFCCDSINIGHCCQRDVQTSRQEEWCQRNQLSKLTLNGLGTYQPMMAHEGFKDDSL